MYLVIMGLILVLGAIFLMNNSFSTIGFLVFAVGLVLMNKGYKKNRGD